MSDPAGHRFGDPPDSPPALYPESWRESETYLYAIDLFNHGYYWEAHEAWESLWHSAGRRGACADWLKGLIKLAAVAVKLREGNAVGVRRHATRSLELLQGVCPSGRVFVGIDPGEIQAFLNQQSKTRATLVADPVKLLPLILEPEQAP